VYLANTERFELSRNGSTDIDVRTSAWAGSDDSLATGCCDLPCHVRADLVAAWTDRRSDPGRQACRILESFNRAVDDTSYDAAPACVNGGQTVLVTQNHRYAVGCRDTEREILTNCPKTVGLPATARRGFDNAVGVDLLNECKVEGLVCQGVERSPALPGRLPSQKVDVYAFP
jgi:hypothetical protein